MRRRLAVRGLLIAGGCLVLALAAGCNMPFFRSPAAPPSSGSHSLQEIRGLDKGGPVSPEDPKSETTREVEDQYQDAYAQ